MAPHSSTLAWKILWTEEPGGLQSMGSLRVGHDWVTSLSLSCIGEGNGNPLQCSCLENPRDRGAWWAAVYGVTQSQTRLKRLSSSRACGRGCLELPYLLWFPFLSVAIPPTHQVHCHPPHLKTSLPGPLTYFHLACLLLWQPAALFHLGRALGRHPRDSLPSRLVGPSVVCLSHHLLAWFILSWQRLSSSTFLRKGVWEA